MNRSAIISSDGRYRWRLDREWDNRDGDQAAARIMLNPTTADGEVDDATIHRVVGFTARLGTYRRAIVVNLFAWRATAPRELARCRDPVGRDNDQHILDAIRDATGTGGIVVAAWGAAAGVRRHQLVAARVRVVEQMLPLATVCLGRTADGHPRHPLYLANATPFTYYFTTPDDDPDV